MNKPVEYLLAVDNYKKDSIEGVVQVFRISELEESDEKVVAIYRNKERLQKEHDEFVSKMYNLYIKDQ